MAETTATDGPPLTEGVTWKDLHDATSLVALDGSFRRQLAEGDAPLSERFERYRAGGAFSPTEESALLVEAARHLARFVAALFGVEAAREAARARAAEEGVLFRFRWSVVQKRIAKKYPDAPSVERLDAGETDRAGNALVSLLAGHDGDEELRVARAGFALFDLGASLATPRPRDATLTLEEALLRIDALRAGAKASSLPHEG